MKTLISAVCFLLSTLVVQPALWFDGAASRIITSGGGSFHPVYPGSGAGGSTSVGVWLKPSVTGIHTNYSTIFSTQGSVFGFGPWTIRINGPTNRFEFEYMDASLLINTFSTAPNPALPSNVWTHIGFSFSYGSGNSNTAVWYINGEPQTGGRWTTFNGTDFPASPAYQLRLGCGVDVGGAQARFFAGQMTEPCFFYKSPLTGAGGINSREASLLARSKVKLVPLQVRGNFDSGDSFTLIRGLAIYWNVDRWTGNVILPSTTNEVRVLGHFAGPGLEPTTSIAPQGTSDGAVQSRPETVCSYLPNE